MPKRKAIERARNESICIWCRNRMVDVCLTACQPEGRYRYLEPDDLQDWEAGPELPPFRGLVDLSAAERLALLYLSACYHEQALQRER
jgi:hypothetical protein